MIDYKTGYLEAAALRSKLKEETYNVVLERIILRHGAPRFLQSDNGTEFKNELIASLCLKFGITQIFNSPYSPQTNGKVERANQSVLTIFAKFIESHRKNWDLFLSTAVFGFNIRPGKDGVSAYERLFGRRPRVHRAEQAPTEYVDASTNDRGGETNQGSKEDKFYEGQVVFIRNRHAAKLEKKWVGPFLIEKRGFKSATVVPVNDLGSEAKIVAERDILVVKEIEDESILTEGEL